MIYLIFPILENFAKSSVRAGMKITIFGRLKIKLILSNRAQSQKAFKKEGSKMELTGTRAREEVRRFKSNLKSVGCFVR